MRTNRHHGFTLIELLTVLAIISVIGALLFSVFATARENGRRASCLSNMRQIGMAMAMYVNDSNNTYPGSCGYGLTPFCWTSQVQPYLGGSTTIFHCPSDPTNSTALSQPGMFVDSYGLNINLLPNFANPLRPGPVIQANTLVSDSHTVMLFEVSNAADSTRPGFVRQGATGDGAFNCGYNVPCGDGVADVTINGESHACPLYATGNIGGRILNEGNRSEARHNGGSNYVACDGHTEWLRPQDVSGGLNSILSSCGQGNELNITSACWTSRISNLNAAGTGFSKYRLTFSTK